MKKRKHRAFKRKVGTILQKRRGRGVLIGRGVTLSEVEDRTRKGDCGFESKKDRPMIGLAERTPLLGKSVS